MSSAGARPKSKSRLRSQSKGRSKSRGKSQGKSRSPKRTHAEANDPEANDKEPSRFGILIFKNIAVWSWRFENIILRF